MQAKQKVGKTALKHVGLVVLMFGFGFALVPLYDVFCEITGLNGKISQDAVKANSLEVDSSREVTVQLVASNNIDMPWIFTSLQDEVKLNPGEWHQVGFWVENNTDAYMVSQSVPSVTPSRAADYIQKTECFCFEQQPLEPGESKQMNMVFTVSPDLPKDIRTVTMVYTIFDSTKFADTKFADTNQIAHIN